jgi:hypothetical protein
MPARHAVAVRAASTPEAEPLHAAEGGDAEPHYQQQFAAPSFADMHTPPGKASAAAITPPTLDVPQSPTHEDAHAHEDYGPHEAYGEGYECASDSRMEGSMAKSIIMSEQLEALTARVPIAGQTVTAIIRLMDLCVAAKPVAQNARELARLCLDVVDLIEDLVDMDDILNEHLFKACILSLYDQAELYAF